VLAGELGGGVGRERVGQHVLGLELAFHVAVGRRGTRVHDALDAGIARGQQHVERAGDVVLVAGQRVVHRARDGSQRRQMEHVLYTAHGLSQRGPLGDAALEQVNGVS